MKERKIEKNIFSVLFIILLLSGCTASQKFTRITENGVITWDEKDGIKISQIPPEQIKQVQAIMKGGVVEITDTGIDTAGGVRSTSVALTNEDGTSRGQFGGEGRSTLQGVAELAIPTLISGMSQVGSAGLIRPARTAISTIANLAGGNNLSKSTGGTNSANSQSTSEADAKSDSKSDAKSDATNSNKVDGGNTQQTLVVDMGKQQRRDDDDNKPHGDKDRDDNEKHHGDNDGDKNHHDNKDRDDDDKHYGKKDRDDDDHTRVYE